MELKQMLVDPSRYGIKCPYSMNPIGITIHNTDNSAPAINERNYMERRPEEVSFHIVVDENEAIQCLPFDRNGWHSGDGGSGAGNRKTIAIEIARSHHSDPSLFAKAQENATQIVAQLCKQFGWGINNIYTHRDWSGKNCPSRTDISKFKEKVQALLNGGSVNVPSTNPNMGDVKVGDKVKATGNVYATGEKIPDWVKSNVYEVIQVSGNKCLLSDIRSWVYSAEVQKQTSTSSTPAPSTGCDPKSKEYTEYGKCTIVTPSGINFRDKPCTHCGTKQGAYACGESVNYDYVVITEKYIWISWIGASSGKRRYMPIKDRKSGDRWGNCV